MSEWQPQEPQTKRGAYKMKMSVQGPSEEEEGEGGEAEADEEKKKQTQLLQFTLIPSSKAGQGDSGAAGRLCQQ